MIKQQQCTWQIDCTKVATRAWDIKNILIFLSVQKKFYKKSITKDIQFRRQHKINNTL